MNPPMLHTKSWARGGDAQRAETAAPDICERNRPSGWKPGEDQNWSWRPRGDSATSKEGVLRLEPQMPARSGRICRRICRRIRRRIFQQGQVRYDLWAEAFYRLGCRRKRRGCLPFSSVGQSSSSAGRAAASGRTRGGEAQRAEAAVRYSVLS